MDSRRDEKDMSSIPDGSGGPAPARSLPYSFTIQTLRLFPHGPLYPLYLPSVWCVQLS